MKNAEIIRECAVRVFGEDRVSELERLGEPIPLHTLTQWRTIHKDFVLRPEAEGHEVLLWFVNSKGRPYRKMVKLYEEKDIVH